MPGAQFPAACYTALGHPTTKAGKLPRMEPSTAAPPKPMNVVLFGAQADALIPEINKYENLRMDGGEPDVVISYGGDGTLLASELHYPGIPKAPILNSRRGHRCIPQPPREVIAGLAAGELFANSYTKLECRLELRGQENPKPLLALNEFSVHMGRLNAAVRWQMWLNDDPYEDGLEILGDGFLVCTPFGSTAYFGKITRGLFTKGIGVAFKATTEHTDHFVLPADVGLRFRITRGPAVLAWDSAPEYYTLHDGDNIFVRKSPQSAVILTCGPVKRLDEPF